eukprot:4690107-Alexandrium_andersonii.AAC.1
MPVVGSCLRPCCMRHDRPARRAALRACCAHAYGHARIHAYVLSERPQLDRVNLCQHALLQQNAWASI